MILGYPVLKIAGGVLAATLTMYLVIQFVQGTGRAEQKLENLRDQIEVREQIDEAITDAPTDVDAALRLLRERQNP